MNKAELITKLKDFDQQHVERFANYCESLETKKSKDKAGAWVDANLWMKKKTVDKLASYFKDVAKDGLVFDGEHITLQSTGVSYDYIAYKNKMFLAYPESKVDVNLVYEGDSFEFAKRDGKVFYTHNMADPFSKSNKREVIGGYCIISNKRGEFITILTREEIDKHRMVAKTDSIWKQWFIEMAMKTVIKKACKFHFADIYQNIEIIDNDNYEIENPLDLSLELKQKIDATKTIDELKELYVANKGKGKAFDKAVSIRKKALIEESKEKDADNPPSADNPPAADKPNKDILDAETIAAIKAITTLEELNEYYKLNKDKGKLFQAEVRKREKEITIPAKKLNPVTKPTK